MQFPLVRWFWISRCAVLLLVGFCGCMASESQQGDTFVYKKTILNTLLLFGIAATLIVFGAGIIRESLQKSKPRKRKRSPSERSREGQLRGQGKRREPAAAPSEKKKTGGVVLGAGLLLGGILILLLGVPSSLVQHITVSPDKLQMRISTLWFAKGTREIPFSEISGIEKIEQEVMARRGKRTDETMVLHLASGTEYIEMGPLEKAAFPKIVEMLEAYRKSNSAPADTQNVPNEQNIAQNPPLQPAPQLDPSQPIASTDPQNPVPRFGNPPFPPQPVKTPTPDTANTASFTPVGYVGRLFPGSTVSVRGLGGSGYTRATILEVYAEGKLKVVPYGKSPEEAAVVAVTQAIPGASGYVPPGFGPGSAVDLANPPAPGTQLLAPHGGRWFPVEVVQITGSSARVKWEGERGTMSVPAKNLRIPPPEGTEAVAGKRYSPEQPPADLTPVERLGAMAKGEELYFREGGSGPPRPVRILQPFREQVFQVQDVKSSEIIYAFLNEISSFP